MFDTTAKTSSHLSVQSVLAPGTGARSFTVVDGDWNYTLRPSAAHSNVR